MTDKRYVLDIDGNKVSVGDYVEVLEIDKNIKLEKDERERVFSMLGDTLKVDEIDDFGCARVTNWFRPKDDESIAHGIALEKEQMRLVQKKTTDSK